MSSASLASCIEDTVGPDMSRSYESRRGILRAPRFRGHSGSVEEEQGIYREEVNEIIGALVDIKFAVYRILGYIEGENNEEEEDEEDRPPDA